MFERRIRSKESSTLTAPKCTIARTPATRRSTAAASERSARAIASPESAGPNDRMSVLRRPPGRLARCSRSQVPRVPAAPVRRTGPVADSGIVTPTRGASSAPCSALERRVGRGLAILRREEFEVLVFAVLDMVDAELRERPGFGSLEQVEHQAMLLERGLSVVGI